MHSFGHIVKSGRARSWTRTTRTLCATAALGVAGASFVACSSAESVATERPAAIGQVAQRLLWPQFPMLEPPTKYPYSRFGSFVDVDGDYAIVGAPTGGKDLAAPAEARAGKAYVYHRTAPKTWELESELKASITLPDWVEFGAGVSIDGDWALVGEDGDSSFKGAVNVFHHDSPGVWKPVQFFRPVNASAGASDYFGKSVNISGDRFVAAAYKTNIAGLNDVGCVYVFDRDPTTNKWAQTAILTANDAQPNDQFGINTRVSGDTIVVGAFQVDKPGSPALVNSGAIYVFEREVTDAGAAWVQKQKIYASDAGAGDNFGVTVSIEGDTIVAGAKGNKNYTGAAYVYERQSNGTWVETGKLVADDAKEGDELGVNVAVSSGHVIVGCGACDSAEVDGTGAPVRVDVGAAYFFSKASGSWKQERKMLPVPEFASSGFGLQVSMDGNVGIAGSQLVGDPDQSGRAYVFEGVDAIGAAQPCDEDQRCGTGHCEDGVCCDTACGECQACIKSLTGEPDGTCAPIPQGTDPLNECTNPTCAGGVQKRNECNGVDGCDKRDIDCAEYACDGAGQLCNASCNKDADCSKDSFCDTKQHKCFGNRTNGTACVSDNQCKSRNCADGVCCNGSCDGQCEACNLADHVGTCTPVTGTPVLPRTACTDNGDACKGTCDGTNRETCAYPGGTTTCKDSTCADSTEQPFTCDGAGACVEAAPIACGNFACGDKGCRRDCSVDQDCASGFSCLDGDCIPTPEGRCSKDLTRVLDNTGAFVKDCAPYLCANAQCASTCTKASECSVGYACDRNAQKCKKVAAPPPSEEVGCFCSLGTGSSNGSTRNAVLATLALFAGVVRRRRQSRGVSARATAR